MLELLKAELLKKSDLFDLMKFQNQEEDKILIKSNLYIIYIHYIKYYLNRVRTYLSMVSVETNEDNDEEMPW